LRLKELSNIDIYIYISIEIVLEFDLV
jgi:hypothetical protein